MPLLYLFFLLCTGAWLQQSRLPVGGRSVNQSHVLLAPNHNSCVARYTFGQPVPGKVDLMLCREAKEYQDYGDESTGAPLAPCAATSVWVRLFPLSDL